MPGIKITDEDRKRINPKFICTSCKLLLHTPYQTTCGHLMCKSCVEALLAGNSHCPEDREELSKEKVFSDAFTKRELNALRLHCVNPDCSWYDSYEKLEGHSQVCERALIPCVHPQCQVKFQRLYLGEHLKSQCECRNVKCSYCREDVPFTSMKEHVETICENAPVTCKYCNENLLRKDIEKHENMFCNEVPASCEFHSVGCNVDKPLKRRELRQHLNDALIDHVGLLRRHTLALASQLTGFIPRLEFAAISQKIQDDITEVRSGIAEKFVRVGGKSTGLERRVESLEFNNWGDTRLRNEVQGLKNKVHELAKRNMIVERELRESQRGRRGPQQPVYSHDGVLLWKIEGYQRKRQDATNGVKTALYSPPFYSAQDGYKMCAKIYMNGDGFGLGTHLSLYTVVMKGDYDDFQTWPLQKKITMMLLDQGNGDHMIDAFNSDPQSSSFQRPKSDMNIAPGSPLFMPLDSLNNRQYIKDDVMFIKIIVDP